MNGYPFFRICRPDELEPVIGNSVQAQYILKYVKDLSCKTCLQEKEYIDRDYMIDYADFYSRSFQEFKRKVNRIHFFTGEFDEDDFSRALIDNDLKSICGDYIGFTVVKPIENSLRQPTIGRTLLSTYSCNNDRDHNSRRIFTRYQYPVHIFGNEFTVETLPFQSQDTAVGACATASLWISCNAMNKLFDTELCSPYEITERSLTYPSISRKFPSTGLDPYQVFNFLWSQGLDTEVLVLANMNIHEYDKPSKQSLQAAYLFIRAFIRANIPIITALSLKREDEESLDYHAAVISGFTEGNTDAVSKLYFHDDQIGPFCGTEWTHNTNRLSNEWVSRGWDSLNMNILIAPIYHKLRLPILEAIGHFNKMKSIAVERGIQADLLIYNSNDYKAELLEQDIVDKPRVLMSNLPRFIIVERFFTEHRLFKDVLLDGTHPFPSIIEPVVEYNQ